MIYRLFKYTIAIFLALIVSVGLTCCIDDDIVADCNDLETDDFAIVFDISLGTNPGGTTRANIHDYEQGDPIDSEVDIKGNNHDFRILFFDNNDNFLFEPTNLQYKIEAIDNYNYDNSNVPTKRWQARIASKVLEAGGVLSSIKNNNFKIAVLANWPKDNPIQFKSGDKVTKLSHYYPDDIYGSTNTTSKEYQAYNFLPSDGKMGAFRDWVKQQYGTQTKAEEAIRNTPRTNPQEIERVLGSPHTYKHIWRVWHFGSEDELNTISTNENNINVWKEKFRDSKSDLYDITNGFSNYCGFYEDDGLDLESPTEGTSYIDGEDLTLAMGLSNSDNNNTEQHIDDNRLKFKAFAQGTLKVIAKKATDKEAWLGMQRKENSKSNKDYRKTEQLTNEFKTYTFANIAVTGTSTFVYLNNPEIISIYAVDGPIIIKQIEYIEDYHLQYTDREGIIPDNTQLIPMYGIQQFNAIGKYLVTGQTLNLSSYESGYPGQRVHLLRSLAKVELFIPADWEQPSHAYFRCMNRTNRCEPVDVSKPTNVAWNEVDREIENIKNYKYFYDNSKDDFKSYRNKLAWFYGAWQNWGWNWNGATDIAQITATNYPHIFNTRISRSDYCYFRKMETSNNYTRYVLYVPEKNIDDTGTVGSLKGTPKIPHIELRFPGINKDENLDDNDCYRIYFVDTGKQPEKSPSTAYDDKEKTEDFLKELYPIMRNHIYRFTVKFQEKKEIEVIFDVDPWDEMELNPSFGLDDKDGVTDNDPWDENEQNPNAGQDDKDGTVDNDPWDESDQNPSAGQDDKDGTVDNDPWDESDQNPSFGN